MRTDLDAMLGNWAIASELIGMLKWGRGWRPLCTYNDYLSLRLLQRFTILKRCYTRLRGLVRRKWSPPCTVSCSRICISCEGGLFFGRATTPTARYYRILPSNYTLPSAPVST